jgi:hypothetical protein
VPADPVCSRRARTGRMQRGTHTAVHRSQDRVASIPTLPKASIATPDELAGYDAIVFGAPTRFGNVSS